jgi:hypothetical protein
MTSKNNFLNFVKKPSLHFIFLFLSALTAAFLWIFYLSRGFSQPGLLDAFIEIQARAIQSGQLAITPDFHRYFYHDASLYQGNYYFYWGLLPALLHAVLSILLGRTLSGFIIVFVFLFLFFYFFQGIILEIINASTGSPARKNILHTGAAIVLAWIFIFILPFPYEDYEHSWFFGRFVIYEQQILFGLGLAMPGLFYLIKGMKNNSPVPLLIACCFFTAAAWVRGTWFLFSIIAVPVIFSVLLMKKSFRPSLKRLHYFMMIIPLLLIGGLPALNYVRFDSIYDFGMKLQFPIDYTGTYVRIQNGIFSPLTHFYNVVFKFLSYYTSPGFIQSLDLQAKSASWSEFTAPYLFHNNLLLLALLPVAFYGAYRAFRTNRKLFQIILILGAAAILINGVIVTVGTIVAMRYFVECYYVTILLIFAGLTAAVSVKLSFPLLLLVLSFHLPATVRAFTDIRPELRLIRCFKDSKSHFDYRIVPPMRTFSVFSDIYWPEGTVTGTPGTLNRHNSFGMIPRMKGGIDAWDVSVIYVKPQLNNGPAGNKAMLEFAGIKSLSKAGRVIVYLEKTKIAEFHINPWKEQSFRTEINYNFKNDAPYRLLIYFFEEEKSFLPPKPGDQPSFSFETIRLVRQ